LIRDLITEAVLHHFPRRAADPEALAADGIISPNASLKYRSISARAIVTVVPLARGLVT
jgi:hypothetical protein